MGIGTFRSRWNTCEAQVQVHGRSGPGGLDLWYQVPNTWGTCLVGSPTVLEYKSACFASGHSTNAKPHAPLVYRFTETEKNNESNHHTRVATLWPLHGTFKSRMRFWLAFPSETICAETPTPPSPRFFSL